MLVKVCGSVHKTPSLPLLPLEVGNSYCVYNVLLL